MSLRSNPSDPGLNYTFSEPIQRSLKLAADAARAEPGDVEPKHLLLGLLQAEGAIAPSVLDGLGADVDEVTDRVEQTLRRGDRGDAAPERMPFTEEAKHVIELALAEARELESIYVGTEHLLLALLREEGTPVCQVLNSAGVRLEEARVETRRVWESGEDEADTGDNFADEAMTAVLRKSLEAGEESLSDFVRRIGATQKAGWARFSDGSWKTWDELDWEADGEENWKFVVEWGD